MFPSRNLVDNPCQPVHQGQVYDLAGTKTKFLGKFGCKFPKQEFCQKTALFNEIASIPCGYCSMCHLPNQCCLRMYFQAYMLCMYVKSKHIVFSVDSFITESTLATYSLFTSPSPIHFLRQNSLSGTQDSSFACPRTCSTAKAVITHFIASTGSQ